MVNQEDINLWKEKYEKVLKTANELLKKKEKKLEEIRMEIQSLNQQLADFHNSKIRKIINPTRKERINKKIADCLIIINELNNEVSKTIKGKISILEELDAKKKVSNTKEVEEAENNLITAGKRNQQELEENKGKEKEIIIFNNYQDIHLDFTLELQKEWEKERFGYEECKEWIDAGLSVNDVDYCAWLQNEAKLTPKQFLNERDKQKLREKYEKHLENKSDRQQLEEIFVKDINWKENGHPFQNFTKELTQEWIRHGFLREQAREWLSNDLDLRPTDAAFAFILQAMRITHGKYTIPKRIEVEEELRKYKELKISEWKKIDSSFTNELIKEWEEKGFNWEQGGKWNYVGLQPTDSDYATWIRDFKGKDAEWVWNNDNEKRLRKEYSFSLKLNPEVINQIKDFKGKVDIFQYSQTFTFCFTPEQEKLIDKLITDKGLRRRFREYGLCSECQQPYTGSGNVGENWCKWCNAQRFRDNFSNWTSGSPEIDRLIQRYQLEATNFFGVLEWIPYEKFSDVEYLAEGGFGEVYKAKWVDGWINFWDAKNNEWFRRKEKNFFESDGDYKEVVLKSLNNSQNMSAEFLHEITCHKLFSRDRYNNVIQCYGVSRHPQTKNYLMVMNYGSQGNLRQFLSNYHEKLSLKDRIQQLQYLVKGLKDIHEEGLIHKDLHPGNILGHIGMMCSSVSITDLGLCRPVNEIDNNKVYGVFPYVAPEVLREKKYTQASDIYSFGIIAYEIFSGRNYFEEIHKKVSKDEGLLVLEICRGHRPDIDKVPIPQELKDLIRQCWNSDLEKRPTAGKLDKILDSWIDFNAHYIRKNATFYRQYKEIKELFSQNLTETDNLTYQNCSQSTYSSRLLSSKSLSEFQKSKKNSEPFYKTKQLDLTIDLDGFDVSEEQNEQQIEIPPKK